MTSPLTSLPLGHIGLLQQRAAPTVDAAALARTRDAAQDFEAFFISHAFESMYAGLSEDPMFGGGEAEQMFRSFLLQEYGKKVAGAGGVGISDMVQRQLLELQEAPR